MSFTLDDAIIVNTTLKLVQDNLTIVRELALTTDYKDSAKRKIFFDYIIGVKRNYRKLEGILSGKQMPLVRPTGMRMELIRFIDPRQMEAWVDKIQKNMDKIVADPSIKFLKQQYTLLDMILKVLNGDAYFVGCMQT